MIVDLGEKKKEKKKRRVHICMEILDKGA